MNVIGYHPDGEYVVTGGDPLDPKKSRMRECFRLFAIFFKIGAFTFGGGYAMLPFIQHEVCEAHGWISEDEMPDIIAISESTPGPLAVNAATFVGSRIAGFAGAAAATFGVVLPSFLIISLLSGLLNMYSDIRIVDHAFRGIRAGVLALITRSLWNMYRKQPKHAFAYILMAASLLTAVFTQINVIYVILLSGIFGLLYSMYTEKRGA